MKKVLFFSFLLAAVLAGAIFYFHYRPVPAQVLRANLTDAQKMLVTLRRAAMAYQQSHQSYPAISAKTNHGKTFYSDDWRAMRLPDVLPQTGFDYECLSEEVSCRALESGKESSPRSGIQIDMNTGVFSCLGDYKPVTTEGLDGSSVVVACQA